MSCSQLTLVSFTNYDCNPVEDISFNWKYLAPNLQFLNLDD